MSDSIKDRISGNREQILIGEIGALLHDIGKMHLNFIKKQSSENVKGLPHHARNVDELVNLQLIEYFKKLKTEIYACEYFKELKIEIYAGGITIYDMIRYHHNPDGIILGYLEKCDKKDSADDKGVVRKKQSIDNTIISSPFGYPKEKIDLDCLQKRFEDLENSLIGLFKNYISGTMDLSCFRASLINDLKASFTHALGETRIPANNVTLWDHSYSTASLFKTTLAAMACGSSPDPNNLKWRIFGVCWNGEEFINRGRKIADIQSRADIIEKIKSRLKMKFEYEIPLGNAVYEDINGIYFTFPEFEGSEELAKECARDALKIIYDESDSELWPFFTLSKETGTLTVIAEILKFATKKREIPKMTPMLFVKKENNREEKIVLENPEIPEFTTAVERRDLCPVCRIRSKDESKERCDICEERKTGRLNQWLLDRQKTVWIDEVSDKNNRIALISLEFTLDKWLDGTMIGTIYSQSFEDWLDKERENLSKIQDKLKKDLQGKIKKLEREIEGMRKAKDQTKVKDRINEKIKEKKELEQKIKQFTFTLNPDNKTAYRVLDMFFEVKNEDKGIAAKILNIFFEEDIKLNKDTLENHLTNIKERIGEELTIENLATYLFTQNPSPARLYRVWRETEEFFDLVIREIKDKIYSIKWKRIKFSVNSQDYPGLESRLKNKTTYIIEMDKLEPQKLLVFHDKNGEFYTIESLGKFRYGEERGEEGVKEALKQGFRHLYLEDKPDKNLLKEDEIIKPQNTAAEEYYPLIEINKSPLSLRLIVPALDSIKVIELVTKLYNERFEKVIGKLPLNIKLLVSKRKFPLYILLDAEKRMLESEEFNRQIAMNPWWDVNCGRSDKYYGFYPIKAMEEDKKYLLDDLIPLSEGKVFHLLPGYFDFDLLLGTTDRYSIYYKGRKRGMEDYRLFTGRPYYFYQISEMLELWDILSCNLSTTQINFIEETLISRLREWRYVVENDKTKVFRNFAEATLRDAFGDRWYGLQEETRVFILNSTHNGMFLDTINLFRHVIKKGGE